MQPVASGFVLIHRSVLSHWTWRSREPFTQRCAWLDLVISANWQTGHFVASYRFLSQRWKWSLGKVQRFIARLQGDCMIQTATGPYSLKDRQGQPVAMLKPDHQPIHQATHLIISNYFEFQESRYTTRTTNRYKDKERKSPLPKGKEQSDKTETDPQAIKLAHLLRSQILSENGQRKTPTDKQLTTGHHAWARTFRLMIQREKRNPQEIHQAIRWLFTINSSQEARFVVLSASSLRTKYDANRTAMQRTGHATKPPRSPPKPKTESVPEESKKPPKRPQKPPWLR